MSCSLETLFYENGVDVIIQGHEHSYERLWPVYNETVTAKNYINPRAPVHIISGAAGCNEYFGICVNPMLGPKGEIHNLVQYAARVLIVSCSVCLLLACLHLFTPCMIITINFQGVSMIEVISMSQPVIITVMEPFNHLFFICSHFLV